MHASIEPLGADILCRSPNTEPQELRHDGEAARASLEGWATRYRSAVRRNDAGELLTIGRELFAWLDASGWASAWTRATGTRSLEIRVDDPGTPLGRALLDAPWELLAGGAFGHLANDAVQPLELVRRIGAQGEPLAPRHSDLMLMFMAAAPEGQGVLAYEAEEAGILEATERLPLHLVVEESGTARYLGEWLHLDGPFEALHLSCHGDIHPELGPLLALEDPFGDLEPVGPGELARVLEDPERTPLVFLSACRTAEQADATADGTSPFEPFARELIRAGVPNVLGWDGSVYDADAMAFAERLYGELAERTPLPRAAALARLALCQAAQADPQQGRHWHLARLYLGTRGGGALTGRGLPKRRLAADGHEERFLDGGHGEVPIATRREFVGRRRALQAVQRAFRDAAGVLIHGMGNLGKSSLAARVAGRLSGHKTVVIFHRYDALEVFDRVLEAVPAQERKSPRETWREGLLADPATLAEALESLLEGPLDTHPVLLVLDDLEAVLETPDPSQDFTPVKGMYRAPLAAILTTFSRTRSASRLLLTSRYRFTLPDGRGRDMAADLVPIPLQPMDPVERRKQLWAAARQAQAETPDPERQPLLQRALAVAGGNPGLQAILMRPILGGEAAAAEQAFEAIEHYQRHGIPPERIRDLMAQGAARDQDNAVLAFFRRMAFETYRAALSEEQTRMLRAACLFTPDLPIPRTALEAVGRAGGVANPSAALGRLLGLGLADDWGRIGDQAHAGVNPLARPLVAELDDEERARLAEAVLEPLNRAWQGPEGSFARDSRALELARLALAAPAPDSDLLNRVAEIAGLFLFWGPHDASEAHKILQEALDRLSILGAEPSHGLLVVAIDCAERVGDTQAQDRGLSLLEQISADGYQRGSALLRVAARKLRTGDPTGSIQAYTDAANVFSSEGFERDEAIARGGIANILRDSGQLDEALRICTEEQLPVYERLGDLREKAITQGRIADILTSLGRLDEALRIRAEEQLPIFERLGDVYSKATTQGRIADILQTRGQLDEALHIRTKEELPVFQLLGDVREMAITQSKIADIFQARGQLDEALRIYTEEELPVYERLGDLYSKAITQSRIANILQGRGQLDEALHILTDEVLTAFELLGDVLSKAVTQGQIADILKIRGQLDEALRIYIEEQLPVFERLGNVHYKAITQGRIADIFQARGRFDEALRIRTDEELPVYERLGDVRSKAIAQGKIADILQARGHLDEALRIHTEEELPVYERLGDVRTKAVTLGKIADILQARGRLDEALRIRTKEQLPVYEYLGDVHEKAITLGQIADILQARGQLDEALRIRTEKQLPIFERLGEIDGIAHVRFRRAQARLQRGDHKMGAIQEIYEDLSIAYGILVKLGRPDGIEAVGSLLAQVLAMRGRR